MSAFFEREAAEWRKRFAEHEVVPKFVSLSGPMAFELYSIRWAKPGTMVDSITFIIERSYLCVIGDLGDAIYKWSAPLTLGFLNGISPDYMLGKCRASEVGSSFRAWDNDTAKAWLEDACGVEQEVRGHVTDMSETPLQELRARDDMSEDAFAATALEMHESGYDTESASSVREAGMAPHPRFVAHHVGLQMAIAQVMG